MKVDVKIIIDIYSNKERMYFDYISKSHIRTCLIEQLNEYNNTHNTITINEELIMINS